MTYNKKFLLHGNLPEREPENKESKFHVFVLIVLSALIMLAVFHGCSYAYSDEQYVNAIYKAEGGTHAKYPYGIRSTKCSTVQACKEICTTTVRNNRKRFQKFGYKRYSRFIDFLGSRYCPTKGRNLSQAEIKLNGNWIRNVNFYLKKG